MIKAAIKKVAEGKDLSFNEAKFVFLQILEGKVSSAQTGALLMGLRLKGEADQEIMGLVDIMRRKSITLKVRDKEQATHRSRRGVKEEVVLDTCGTGGKKIKTFNISTCVAFVVASLGIKVAKHGNRSFSGKCGSADVLEGLGLDLSASPHIVERAIKRIGIGFMFAPLYHPAMKNVGPVRREIGIRTIFNIAGPLTNPARATHQMLGVYDKNLTEKIARVLKDLGCVRAFIVWSEGLGDEVSIAGQTRITELRNKRIKTFYVTPNDFGLKKRRISDIKGAGVKQNVSSVLGVLKAKPSAKLDAVLINSALCFVLTGKAASFKEGVLLARKQIENGHALNKLNDLRMFLESALKGKV